MNNKGRLRDLATKLYTEDFIEAIEQTGQEIPLYTESTWKQKGYKIKEGENGHMIKLWIKTRNGNYILKNTKVYTQKEVELWKI